LGMNRPLRHYILRITREKWVKQVFSIKKYYPGVRRRWEPGMTILLARKAEEGDSFIGYGIVDRFIKRDSLPDREREECERMSWSGAIVFKELFKFEPPLPMKETILSGRKVKGKCFHGYPLSKSEVESILGKARQLCKINRV